MLFIKRALRILLRRYLIILGSGIVYVDISKYIHGLLAIF